MRLRSALSTVLALAALAVAVPAHAQQDAQGFIQQKHAQLEQILRQPESASRDAQVNQGLDTFVDYDEMTRRTFGEPCPPSREGCEDLWGKLDDAQHKEVTDLLKQLVRKNYRKNLLKTLDYDIDYKGQKTSQGGETRVVTEAQNKLKPRDPPVRVEYTVKQTDHGFICVDFVTEGSSLTKNYYDQFRKKMDDPNLGYSNIVAKLKEKIAKKD